MFKCKSYLVISLFLIFTSCKEEIKLSFSEINITTANNSIVEVNIPKASGNKEVANQINSEIQRIVIASLHIGEPDTISSKSIEESISAFNAEYKIFKADFPETAQVWEAQIDGDIMYQSSEIISIAITSYTNTGGAHGLLNISILNFDSETGKSIDNAALFKNIEAFKSIAKVHFEAETKNEDVFLDNDSFDLPANIGYSDEGMVLLYNAYEIAPYATGIIQFTVPFEEVAGLLNFNSL